MPRQDPEPAMRSLVMKYPRKTGASPCGRYFCSTAAVLSVLVLLSTTSDAAVRNSPKNAARIAVQRSVATPVEHEGVPPMLMETSSVEGYYPLRYM